MTERGRHFGYSVSWAANINKTIVPTSVYVRWLIHEFQIKIVCDATVADRTVQIHPHNYDVSVALNTGPIWRSATAAANATRIFGMGPFTQVTGWTVVNDSTGAIVAPLWLSQKMYWIITTDSGVAGDTVYLALSGEEFVD